MRIYEITDMLDGIASAHNRLVSQACLNEH